MSFFDSFPKPRQPRLPRIPKHQPWQGPEPGWIGGWVPWRVVLLRTPDVYAVLRDFEAFPTGLRFSQMLAYRPGVFDPEHGPFRMMHGQEGLRLGVLFSDGRKAAIGPRAFPRSDKEPQGPVLLPQGGGGGGGQWNMNIWLWPLPPPGPLTWVTSWPERDIPEQSVTVDASALADAAGEAERLWEVNEGDFRSGGVWTSTSGRARSRPKGRPPKKD